MKSLKRFSLLACMCASVLDAQTIMNIHQSNGTILQIPLNTIDSITYTINNPGSLATLSTLPIGNTTATSATSGGNITNDGGTNVTQRGVVWSTSPNPTTANNLTSNGSGTGNYSSTITGLTANTMYYVRAYATNSAGTAYGNQLSFTTSGGGDGTPASCGAANVHNPAKTYGSMTDQQGNVYKTIVIGSLEWMAENLKTSIYRNGEAIANVTDGDQWLGLTTGAWCYYNNDSQYECPYGKLYNWYAVADPRNVCPTGWHVPTDAEWSVLINYLDPNAAGGDSFPNIAGGKLKSAGLQYWLSPNTDATNESGFSGLPAGNRSLNGAFNTIGDLGVWWSSTEYGAGHAWTRALYFNNGGAYRYYYDEAYGFSVRCLRD
jgi:uncharacterized protein (TIGR02145 family)